jgi:hypothetical protein
MNLIKWELMKIFKQKSLYIVGIFLLGWFTLIAVTNVYDTNTTREVYQEWEGRITSEKIEKARKINNEWQNDRTEYEDGFDERRSALGGVIEEIAYSQSIKGQIKERETDLKQLIADANSTGDTSLANKLTLQKDMYNKIDINKISYHTTPREAIDFVNVFGLIFTGLFLLLGLASIYSHEHASGVENYILSTKNGRSVTMKAKLLASFLYTFIVVVVWESFNLIVKTAIYGAKGWDLPIQYAFKYTASPYSFTFLEYHLIQLGFHFLGALAFAAVIVLVSTLVKSTMISFFVSGFLFGVPILAESIFSLDIRWIHEVLAFSLTNIMKVEGLFMNFLSVDVFNQPILAPIAAVLVAIVVLVACIISTGIAIKRKQIA